MANKKVGVDIAFNADTSKAKASIQELQTLLNKITYSGASGSGSKNQMAEQLQSASAAAKELQYHLNNAFNAKTGKLDLSLLDKSLASTNSDITKLSTNLLSAGTNGQQAFVKVAQAIAQAEQPMVRVNDKIKDFAVSLKNAAKYQLSNAIIQGFTTSLNAAVGYAKDLNSSLNEIRIVSGKGADEMARFAEEANKSAKRLSTTTTDYTKASLIYYQQGLSDQEVADRTETTIKMANVAGTSAQKVSDQMTAVWNNFYDGSKSLEYYSDVMVKLGAATASSTDEISEGVNKFAATAKTVGLSYEYAASALATVTARTRESADVVGNAMKTLFARIQGLNLGETLDDGTTLNKYSKALEAVGIDIKTQSGDLKDMDDILDELGEKWGTISRDQQTALAQTVAGVRQYSQLMALMNNWDYFKENLQVAYGSEGELEAQAEIYAESWEAAEKRVKASMQGVYQAILDDKFFITLNNGFANALGGLEAFIEGAGGVGTIITGISSIIVGAFAHKIPDALQTARYNFDVLTKGTEVAYKKIQKQMEDATQTAFDEYKATTGKSGIDPSSSMGLEVKFSNELLQAKNKLAQVSDKVTNAQKQQYDTELALIEAHKNETIAIKQKKEELQSDIEKGLTSTIGNRIDDATYTNRRVARYQAQDWDVMDSDMRLSSLSNMSQTMLDWSTSSVDNSIVESLIASLNEANVATQGLTSSSELYFSVMDGNTNQFRTKFSQITNEIKGLSFSSEESFNAIRNNMLDFINLLPESVTSIREVREAISSIADVKVGDKDDLVKSWENLYKVLNKCKISVNNLIPLLSETSDPKGLKTFIAKALELGEVSDQDKEKIESFYKLINNFNPQASVSGITALAQAVSTFGSLGTTVNILKSLGTTMTNPDISGWEAFASIMTGLGSLVPMVINVFNQLGDAQLYLKGKKDALIASMVTEEAVQRASVKADAEKVISEQLGVNSKNILINKTRLKTATETAGMTVEQLSQKLQEKGIVLDTTSSTLLKASIKGHEQEVVAILAENVAKNANVQQTKTQVVWQTILNALTGQYGKLIMMSIGVLAVAGITLLIKSFKSAAKAQEEAVEATQKSLNTYEEQKNKVGSLNSELEELSDTIDKLLAKDSLSIVEKEQLSNAQSQKVILEQQLALEQAITKEKEKQAIADWESGKEKYDNWTEDLPNYAFQAYKYVENEQTGEITPSITDFDYITSEEEFQQWMQNEWSKWYEQQYPDSTAEERKEAEGHLRTSFDEVMAERSKYITENADAYRTDLNGYQLYYSSLTDEDKKDPVVQTQLKNDQERLQRQAKAIYGDTYYDTMDKNWEYGKNNSQAKQYLESGKSQASELALLYSDETKELLQYMGMSIEDYAQHQIDQYSKYDGLFDNNPNIDDLSQLTSNKKWKQDYYPLLDELEVTVDDTVETIFQKLQEAFEKSPEGQFNLSTWKTQYNALQEAVKDSTKGDNIDADLYNQLSEEYQKYFEIQRDGTYALTISAKEFKSIVEGIKSELLDDIDNKQGIISNIAEDSGFNQNGISNSIIQWKASLENGENMSSQANSGLARALSENLGIDKGESSDAEYIQNLINAYQALETELATLQEGLGQVSNSVSELDGYLVSGRITSEQYDKALNGVIKTEAEANDIDYSEIEDYAGTLQEVNEKLKGQEALSKKIALAEKKQAKGADDLKDNYKDYVKVLNQAKTDETVKDTEEYSKTLNSLRKDLSLLTGVEEDVFSDEFVNSDEVQKTLLDISNGVDGATEKLKVLATMEEIHLKVDDADAWTKIQSLTDEIVALSQDDTIRIGTTIDNSSALQGLEDLLYQSGLTTEQIQKIFNDLGWQPEMSYTEMTVAEANKVGTYTNKMVWVPDKDGLGWHQEKLTDSGIATVDENTVIRVPTIGSKKGFTKIDPPGNGSTKKPDSGSGGGKTAKHAEKKNDSDKERYHTVLNQLEDLNSEYDDISKAKDRAFGKDRLKNMDEEIAKTDELIDKQKEYLDAIENYLPLDLAAMIGSYEDTIGGPSILFDEKGNISNFDEIQDAMFAKYNEMADAFDEDSTDWQIFEKKYEQLEKYIEQYEETYDLLRDQEQEYQDLINQRLDAQLEKVQYTVEVKLDVSEDQVKLLEYQLGRIEDDSFKSLEAIGLLTEKANELNKQIETNKQGLNDALNLSLSTAEIAQVMAGNLSVLNGKNFTDDQISAIKEYRDNILDLNGELDDLREEIESKLMDAFDTWQEKLEKGVDTLDHYGSILESYKNIIDIVGTDALGLNDEFMNDLAQGSVDNAINKLEAVKSEYRSIENARAEAEAKLKDAQDSGDTKSAEMWEQTLADLTEKSQEAQENMLSAWEDALDRLAEQFEQSAERIAESFNKSIYNLGGLEGLGNDFDKAQDRADIMLDDYQKIYELSKLSRDINKSIDDTDLIGGKEKLKKLLGDVNALQEDGVEMSQYDLEYLQKTYDLRLAELELEEAQRAKNTVRLSKDNEGNWSYIYTQNSDAVDQAQQKYEDALYAMQDLSSNYIDEMSEKLIDTSQEMAEALAELRIQDFASIDDYYAEVDRIQKYYQEQLDLQENELNKAILNNKTLYDEDWTAYHNATGYKISDTEDFVTAFKDSMLGTLMGSETDMSDFTEIIKGSLATMTEQLLQAADTYYRNLQEAMNAADTSIEDFGEDIGASIDEITAKSEEGASSVEDMADRMNTAVNDLMDTIQTWQESYGLAMEEIINDNLAVIESINELTKKLSLEDYDASVSWNLTRKDKDTPTGMASGGYTGSWGKEGKLGILHEKELVLNATDTANMLDMLQITRDMINTIDLQTQNAKLGLGELVASTIRDPLSEVLEQNVHITAEFPNVTDHNEIEQALLNLNNTASQYANRK